MDLTILVRASDDPRVIACLDSIDVACSVVASITPNPGMEADLARRGVPYALSPKGNPAATTVAGLTLCHTDRILLVDSDCTFLPGAIQRLFDLSDTAAIVRPNILFDALSLSSRATQLARTFQYTYCGFVYEPGLLVNLKTVLPHVGGYLFSPHAPYTPDGEFDYRVRQADLSIATDPGVTLVHAALPFKSHLRSYWRYGYSEASRMIHLRQPVLRGVVSGLPYRYRSALSRRYPPGTVPIMLVCDTVYLTSTLYHLRKLRQAKSRSATDLHNGS